MRRRRLLALGTTAGAVAVAALGFPLSAASAAPAADAPGAGLQRVVVTGQPGQAEQVARDVQALGGVLRSRLAIVDGGVAELPADRVARLRRAPGVRSVTPDHAGRLLGSDPALGYDVTRDDGSLYNIAQITRAKDAWAMNVTGKGVDVAVIDSGVVPVTGLTSGNVVHGPDLSFESQNPALLHKDTYGHGTHMASIIAGRDAAAPGPAYARPDQQFTGMAPDARLVSLKVAASDGGTDVSQVIAAIDWVTQHAHDPGMNVRVLNLSFGTDSVQDPALDPLVYAAENAWRSGIVVVAASGNDGSNRQALADPAISPLVLAVGADDPMGTEKVQDDTVPAFAQRGTAARPVDLVAPGVHVLGLRDPNSAIDQDNPSARVGSRFFRGSGTSQAAAVVSGLSALYLSKHPDATPDQVKKALMANASMPSAAKRTTSGAGVPDVKKAIGAPLPLTVQAPTGSTGLGTLEAARGSVHVDAGYGALTGEQDIFGTAWRPEAWAPASAMGQAWQGGSWNGNDWTGSAWTDSGSGLSWASHAWSGTDWMSHAWSSHAWSSHAWSSHAWSSHAWSDSSWSSHAWSNSSWGSHAWSSHAWSTGGWMASDWS